MFVRLGFTGVDASLLPFSFFLLFLPSPPLRLSSANSIHATAPHVVKWAVFPPFFSPPFLYGPQNFTRRSGGREIHRRQPRSPFPLFFLIFPPSVTALSDSDLTTETDLNWTPPSFFFFFFVSRICAPCKKEEKSSANRTFFFPSFPPLPHPPPLYLPTSRIV